MNNGVEENQVNSVATPVLTVDNNTSTVPSSFSVVQNSQTPTLTVVNPAPVIESATPVLTIQNAEMQPVISNTIPLTTPPTSAPVIITQPVTIPAPVMTSVETPVVESIQTVPVSTPIISEPTITDKKEINNKKTNKKVSIIVILLIIVLILSILLVYNYLSNKRNLSEAIYNCSPLKETKEGVELDLDSTLVKDLYSKVYTSIREDYAEGEFTDNMKLYLAYRQVTDFDKYESNCNMFDNYKMEPYTCNDSQGAKPKAISLDTMLLKWKTLYGEDTPMPLTNIKLTNLCIGGYQYIPEREEFVEGTCNQSTAVTIRADKNLTSAISYNNTIILTENVRYYAPERMTIPAYLKNGNYKYVFKLDTNYNYVLISKTYEQKY